MPIRNNGNGLNAQMPIDLNGLIGSTKEAKKKKWNAWSETRQSRWACEAGGGRGQKERRIGSRRTESKRGGSEEGWGVKKEHDWDKMEEKRRIRGGGCSLMFFAGPCLPFLTWLYVDAKTCILPLSVVCQDRLQDDAKSMLLNRSMHHEAISHSSLA